MTCYQLVRSWTRTYKYFSNTEIYEQRQWIHPGSYKKLYQRKFKNERKLTEYLKASLPNNYSYTFFESLEGACNEFVFLINTDKKCYTLRQRPKKQPKKYRKYRCDCWYCDRENRKKNFIPNYLDYLEE